MCLIAQTVLESGHYKYVRNYNLGGIKATDKWKGDWQYFTTHEYFNKPLAEKYLKKQEPEGKVELVKIKSDGVYEIKVSGKHSLNRFVSFDSLEEYCAYHIKFMLGRFKPALELAMRGDAEKFCFKLRELDYYTDSADQYAGNVVSLVRTYSSKVTKDPELPDIIGPGVVNIIVDRGSTKTQISTDAGLKTPGTGSQSLGSIAVNKPASDSNPDLLVTSEDSGPKYMPDQEVHFPQFGRRNQSTPGSEWVSFWQYLKKFLVKTPMP